MEYKLEYFIPIIVLLAVIYCEFLADYVAQYSCAWPELNGQDDKENELKAMILADTHILGPIRGHWLDKFYREWHMRNAFQAALTLLRPEIVFILGDLFDEGDLIDHKQFQEHVIRFKSHFHTDTTIISAVGNHDVGFHYRLHSYFTQRFEKNFNNTGVQMYSIKNVHFVLINSMAMENDNCYFCDKAIKELKKISEQLKCLQMSECAKKHLFKKHGKFSPPIVMQHFPTFRASDKECLAYDAPKIEKFRENWEVLSKESTDLIGKLLRPRLAFAGHSHHYCLSMNRWHVEEFTVASFSWRNKVDPSFLLAKFSPTRYAVLKCNMLKQEHVYKIYLATATIFCLCLINSFLKLFLKYRRQRHVIKKALTSQQFSKVEAF